jgi:serine-type D-Ala-D-Ala carboxypeptidase/endopeptidase (penicillin-binding protein 4)
VSSSPKHFNCPPLAPSCLCALLLFLIILLSSPNAPAEQEKAISSLLGEKDSCLLVAPDGAELVAIHADTPLIPASTLKIFTALVGFHYLGSNYRFPMDIYLNAEGDLSVKGYGDPLLISEVLQKLAAEIRRYLPGGKHHIRHLILDDTYFASPLTIPGVSDSSEPYDAPNGALCANFNTISFRRESSGGYVSGEAQTPLLPTVLSRVRRSGLREGRIPLSSMREESTGYTGYLLRSFLEENGVSMTGSIRFGSPDTTQSAWLFTFLSPFTLSQAVSKLLEFSNNFMANQLLIAAGAKAFGPPGTLEKGNRAANAFAADQLSLRGFKFVEGSGISRENRISARMMLTVLKAFQPYHTLMQQKNHAYYKTGTLNGIATRAGYLADPEEGLCPFVVMLNSSERNIQEVMSRLLKTSHW